MALMDNRQELLRKSEAKKQTARNLSRATASAKIINDHIKRGHTCCLDKGDVPANFIKCIDCKKELDKTGEV